MPTSPTDICNRALGRLGDAGIVDMDENSTAARACRLHYSSARDALLRTHPWNFAIKRETLSELTPVPAFSWEHKYQLPVDFIRLLQVNGSDIDLLGNDWTIEGDQLLANSDTAEIVYIYRCEDPALWDTLFQDAMSLKLAIRLAETIRGGASIIETLQRELEQLTAPMARRISSNENRGRDRLLPYNSAFVASRGAYWERDPSISGYGL